MLNVLNFIIIMFLTSLTFKPVGLSYFAQYNKYGVSDNTKYTNNTNERMNKENNQTQIDLWNQQKEYDYQMWQENNAYNAPSAQVQRLKDAGLNPALAMSQISTGTSSASAGGQTPPATTAAHNENPANEVLGKIQNIALLGKAFADIQKQTAETESIEKQNFWIDANNLAELDSKKSNSWLAKQNGLSKLLENHFNSKTFTEREQQLNTMGEILTFNKYKADAEAQLQVYMKQHMQNVVEQQDPLTANNLRAAYADAFASIALKYSNIQVNSANIKKIGAEVNKLVKESDILDKTGRQMNTDFYISDQTAGSVIQKIISEGSRSQFDNTFGLFLDYMSKFAGFVPK